MSDNNAGGNQAEKLKKLESDVQRLNAKFAHDISTPLLVAKMNVSLLNRYADMPTSEVPETHREAVVGAPTLIGEQIEIINKKLDAFLNSTQDLLNIPKTDFPSNTDSVDTCETDESEQENHVNQPSNNCVDVSGLKVLLVDDETIHQDIASHLLTKVGCQVDIAADGREAMEKATATEYQMYVVDLCLPDIDGIELAKKFRERGGQPIITLTNMPFFESDVVDGFIRKPFKLPEFRQLAGELGLKLPQES